MHFRMRQRPLCGCWILHVYAWGRIAYSSAPKTPFANNKYLLKKYASIIVVFLIMAGVNGLKMRRKFVSGGYSVLSFI